VKTAAAVSAPTPPSLNLYDTLDRDDNGEQYDNECACKWAATDIQTSHEAWGHPGHSKYDAIITTYPDIFPEDKKYRAAARQHRCPVCDLMKGARHYRKSKRMKQKLARDHQRKHAPQQAARASILQQHLPPDPYAATAVALHGQASVCDAHKPCRRVRFASDTVEHRLLPEDDFLVMVIDGIDFLWATPTAHKSSPEALLESFLIGQLPREHPLVANTTHSDRGLEGAFLGWDLATPTVWMWSFLLKKPIRLHDPTFYDSKYPFADPSCLVNRSDLTVDAAVDEDTESDEEAYSTPPTQPRDTPRKPASPPPAPPTPERP